MKEIVASLIQKEIKNHLKKEDIENLIEIPPSNVMGDFAFPCFALAKELKKNPAEIAKDLAKKIKSSEFEKIEARGPYLNFFVNRASAAEDVLGEIQKQKDSYGSSNLGKGKVIVIDMSSPNIAKPFGIGHLRSTIIGNSISNICEFAGFKAKKLNYYGDWGTPFGKIIAGYEKFGNAKKLEKEPIKHLYEIYTKVSKNEDYEEIGREYFKKLEGNDKKVLAFWKKFRELSINDFNKIYSLLNIKFDVISSESEYNSKMEATINELKQKKLLEESEGAQVVDLEKYGLGVCLIKKSDGTTLYATRDITAAIDRHKRFNFERMFYEVGAEQNLHFRQIFKVLELMGYKWAENCMHISHGLYLDKDGKKFATRKGKTIFMEDILDETISLAKKEISKREKLPAKELDERALAIARAAIIYGDLKNYRANDMVFDISKFVSFEGNTGPYLLYSYARARSILKKSGHKPDKNYKPTHMNEKEKSLVLELGKFPEILKNAYSNLSPNVIANYAYELSQLFNEFYHADKVIGSENEKFLVLLVDSFSQVLKNSLALLGIEAIEKM